MLAAEGGLDQAVGVVGEFLERASGRTLTWFQTEGRLVADIDGHLYDLRLDGEVENTPLEVLGAIVDSFYEQRHELLRADPLPGPQTFFGAAFEFIGAVTAPPFNEKDTVEAPRNWLMSDNTTEGYRTSETIVQRLRTAMKPPPDQRQPDDILIAGIALQGGPDQSFLSVSQSFAAECAAMPPELQEQLQEQPPRHRPVNRSKPTWKDWSIPATRYAVSWTRLLRV